MAKSQTRFVCQACGALAPRWSGKCESCGEWNSIIEEGPAQPVAGAGGKHQPRGKAGRLVGLKGSEPAPPRILSGMAEFDRVTGGGLVPGSGVLIGGDPGIGKSTLLIQVLAGLARAGHRVVYVSGEEAIAQVRLRAERLGLADAPVLLATMTSVPDILATISEEGLPLVTVIDSIQTLWTPVIEAAPGTVSQLRAGAEALIRFAKHKGTCVLLVGHVTKEGQIAGPKVIEHMVDTVLYFEGDPGHQFRILRAVKNRFGPTDEIGVFEMSDRGLAEVANPSRLFMGTGHQTPGAAVFAGVEGTRPLLMEVQALVSPSSLGTPRRAVVGWDQNRLAMVLAVLETHAGVRIGANDVYLNVAGGLRVKEPAADLAVAAALVSSLSNRALPPDLVLFGEISLSGALRPVSLSDQRLREAVKLGLKTVVMASGAELSDLKGLEVRRLDDLAQLAAWIAALPA